VDDALARTRPANTGVVTLEVLLAHSLDERCGRYIQVLRRIRKNPSEKLVHDLRVATRRLISTIDLISTVLSDSRLQAIRTELKNGLKGFNPLRDVQVQLLTVEQMLPTYPMLEPFHTILLLRERRLVKEISKHIARVPAERMEKDVRAARKQLRSLFRAPAVHDVAFAAVVGAATIAFARAVERRSYIDAKKPEAIHRLRVAFKKVRYTLEALQPVFPGVTQQQLKKMNEYQQLMGDVQDLEVLRVSVNAYAVRRHKMRDVSLLAVHQELLRRRDECIRKFLPLADGLFSFWHPEFIPRASLELSQSRTRH